MKKRTSAVTGCLIAGTVLLLMPSLAQAAAYNFQTINNNGDPNFNQLLGINSSGTIAGYFGDSVVVPNNGYTVTSPYGQGNFTAENVPGAVQTQVIGINNSGVTVGFSVDANGTNTGFVHSGSTFTTPVVDPNTPTAVPSTNQLLGLNNNNQAAGFYVNSNGNAQAYVYNISAKTFTAINPTGATASTAAGVNNAGDVAGFLTNASGNTEAFYFNGSTFTEFEAPGSTNTGFFGLNNKGIAVGYYVDANGITNGLVYNVLTNAWSTVNDPNGSSSPAFAVTGTTINGINDAGQLVGFFSDGTHVNGLLATPTPEPASFALMGVGALLGLGMYRKFKKSGVS
ncbi:MAG TPA: PEP-CTERM sorting domain-containing protein [Bryobacteraceae bacterium]|nr:PEP-CTERM sorting domain-containing protein [Bryobacteraceae bacterium]